MRLLGFPSPADAARRHQGHPTDSALPGIHNLSGATHGFRSTHRGCDNEPEERRQPVEQPTGDGVLAFFDGPGFGAGTRVSGPVVHADDATTPAAA